MTDPVFAELLRRMAILSPSDYSWTAAYLEYVEPRNVTP